MVIGNTATEPAAQTQNGRDCCNAVEKDKRLTVGVSCNHFSNTYMCFLGCPLVIYASPGAVLIHFMQCHAHHRGI